MFTIGSTIALKHEWSGETRDVEIIAIYPLYIVVHWGQAGNYELRLNTNTLHSCSPSARRKAALHGNPPLWQAMDIQSLRNRVKDYTASKSNRDAANLKNSIARHEASMPGIKKS